LTLEEKRKVACRAVSYFTVGLQYKHVWQSKPPQGFDCVGTMVRNYYQTKYVLGDLREVVAERINYMDLKLDNGSFFVPNFIDRETGNLVTTSSPWSNNGMRYNDFSMKQIGTFYLNPVNGKLGNQDSMLKLRTLNPINGFEKLKSGDAIYMIENRKNDKSLDVYGHIRTVVDVDPENQIVVFMEGRTNSTPIFYVYYYGSNNSIYKQIFEGGINNGTTKSLFVPGLKYITLQPKSLYLKNWLNHINAVLAKNPAYYPFVYVVPFGREDWMKSYG
jgi:hypothetical protein